MTQILNRWNGNVIIEGEMNLTELVIHAVKTGASLDDASLNRASLNGASLDGTSLDGAFLDGANIDYTGWPLRCSSLTTNVCDKIAAQLLFHAFAVARINPTDEQITFIRNFHRFDECGGVNRLVKKP